MSRAIFLLTSLLIFAPAFCADPLKADPDLAKREEMVKISRQLGVTCNHCHDIKNFRSDKMENFKISKQHIRIVDILNTRGFTGAKAPKADCYMCHRGKALPEYKEPK